MKARIDHLVGDLGEGDVIPTERDLSEAYGVARETVRQALRELVLEGKLRRQGRGTLVAGPKLEQPLSLAGYTEGVRRQGRTPGRGLVTPDRFPCPPALAAETVADLPGVLGRPAAPASTRWASSTTRTWFSARSTSPWYPAR